MSVQIVYAVTSCHAITGPIYKWSGGGWGFTPLETGKLSHWPLVGGAEAEQAEHHWPSVERRRSKAGADPTFKGVVSLWGGPLTTCRKWFARLSITPDHLLPRTVHSVTVHLFLHSKTHPLFGIVHKHTSIQACHLHFFYNPYNYVPFQLSFTC